MEWFNQLGYRDCTRHGLMTSSEMDSYDPCGFSLSLIYLESTFIHSCNRWVPWGRVLWGMKVNLKQKRPVQTALLVKYMKFNDTKTWNSAGGSKQLDHALPGFADSDPFHWNEKGQEALGGFSGSTNSWASVCAPEDASTHLVLAGSPRRSGCSSGPEVAAPRSSGQPRCCSTSRAASRTPPTLVSERPCSLWQKHVSVNEQTSIFQEKTSKLKKKWPKEWRPTLTYILCCSAIFFLLLVKTAPKPNLHKHKISIKEGQTYLGS